MSEKAVSRELLEKYLQETYPDLSAEDQRKAPAQRMEAFRERIKSFEKADEETRNFRDACRALGSPVIFRSPGISDAKAIEILGSDAALKAISDPDRCVG